MTVALTIRDVPEEVRDALSAEAKERGQSLQAYLLAMMKQQAGFSRNRRTLLEIERDLLARGGAGPDAPSAADLINEARGELDLP